MNVREATATDLPALCEIYNHYVKNTHVTFDMTPVTTRQRAGWLAHYNQRSRHRLFVGEAWGEVVGYACSSQFRPRPAYDQSVETTIYLAPDAMGQGYGRMLYSHLLDSLEDTDVHRCYGIIALPNEASVRLHKSLGFAEVGHFHEVGYKFNQYWDTLWLERRQPG